MPLPTDPMLSQQWHLINPVSGLLDLNVAGVWNAAQGASYTGAGVRVVVIDDGFDYNHTDLAPNYNLTLDYDFENNTDNPFGLSAEGHGTAVSGIIAADNNGTGVVGVAFDSELVGYRTEQVIGDPYLATIAEAIAAAAGPAGADVINISQGIANDLNSEFGFGYTASLFDDIETSIGTAVDSGRDGLGSIIVKGAGNSRSANYDVNSDDWTNDTRQVVVAAVDQNGFVSSYSSFGDALLVSGFGTPGQVVTTDRSGAAGYSATDFTSAFNGTSAAAPMVSGVVALMLEANDGLGWRDVQTILANSARHVGSAIGSAPSGSEGLFGYWRWNAAATWNGGGLHFSNSYGYGLVDALAAVRMAETWLLGGATAAKSSNQNVQSVDMLDEPVSIPDNNFSGTTFTGALAGADVVERVTLKITFSTTSMADLVISIRSPDGTDSFISYDQAGSLDFDGTWTFETQAFRGERADGTWSVQIIDSLRRNFTTVSDIVLTTHGAATTDDRYVYTNEYSDYAGTSGHVINVVDTNGGIDTVNASAVTSASVINLDGLGAPASSIDGVLTTFTGIENAIGGDGEDLLIGTTGANQLFGMRGGDTLLGNDGNDTLDGGTGADEMSGGRNNDTYYVDNINDKTIEKANEGFDIVYSSVSYQLSGTFIERLELTGTNSISATGNSQANTLVGNEAANFLDGLGNADSMSGGRGDDTYYVDHIGDRTIERVNEGFDTVNSAVSFNLAGTFIEKLVLFGANAISATGNSQANILVGSDFANVLNGLGGADSMTGGKGDDTYFVDHTGDRIVELFGEGFDTVSSTISFNLAGIFVDRLELTGSNPIAATGNSQANTLTGNTAANLLSGLGGADVLDGRGGADTLSGGTGRDSFAFTTALGSGNIDTISDFSVIDDTIQLARTIFTGLTGSGLAASAFFIGAGAGNADHRIIYNDASGALLFDMDGTGTTAAVQFASLASGLAMTSADFILV